MQRRRVEDTWTHRSGPARVPWGRRTGDAAAGTHAQTPHPVAAWPHADACDDGGAEADQPVVGYESALPWLHMSQPPHDRPPVASTGSGPTAG